MGISDEEIGIFFLFLGYGYEGIVDQRKGKTSIKKMNNS